MAAQAYLAIQACVSHTLIYLKQPETIQAFTATYWFFLYFSFLLFKIVKISFLCMAAFSTLILFSTSLPHTKSTSTSSPCTLQECWCFLVLLAGLIDLLSTDFVLWPICFGQMDRGKVSIKRKVGGSIPRVPSSPVLYVEVSLGNMLIPRLQVFAGRSLLF